MVQQLMFGNRQGIPFHTLWWIQLLIDVWIKVNRLLAKGAAGVYQKCIWGVKAIQVAWDSVRDSPDLGWDGGGGGVVG